MPIAFNFYVGDHVLDIADQCAFGEFKFEAMRIGAGFLNDSADLFDEIFLCAFVAR